MDIYVEPYEYRMSADGFNISKTNITSWEVKEFNEDNIIINLKFESPSAISPLPIQDKIVVHFRNESRLMIMASLERVNLHNDSTTLRAKLRK